MSVVDNKTKISVKTEGGVTYGVSIADLREAFGSSRVDLLAIICEDRPAMASADADAADGITDGEGNFLYSAFALSDFYINSQGQWTRRNAIPIPSGWSFIQLRPLSFPSGRSYEKGDLIQGRYPKWHLWADGINVGKVIEDDGYTHRLRYNIFKNPWSDGAPLPTNAVAPGLWPEGYTVPSGNKTSGHIPDLFSFQGYMTKVSHEPIAEITGAESEWHNGMPVVCKIDNALRCVWRNTFGGIYENTCAFADLGSQIMGKAKIALGNIVDWWRKTAYSNNELYGMIADIKYLPRNHGEQTTPLSIAFTALHVEQTQLGYDTEATKKQQYRDGVEEDIGEKLGVLRTIVWNDMMYGGIPEEGEHREIGVSSQLVAIRRPIPQSTTPDEPNDKVYVDDVMVPSTNLLKAIIDPCYRPGSSRYRFIISNETAIYERHSQTMEVEATYDLPIVSLLEGQVQKAYYAWPLHMNNDLPTYADDANNSGKHCIRFQFALLENGGNETAHDFVPTETVKQFDSWSGQWLRLSHFFAIWDVACCDEADGRVKARYKGMKRVEHLRYEVSEQSSELGLPTYFANIGQANGTPFPRQSSGTGVSGADTRAYVTGVKVSDIMAGSQDFDDIPENTTAKLTLVGEDSVPHFLASPQYYDKISDSFIERVEREIGPSYNWYIQNYDPLFRHDNNSWKLGPLVSQAWELDASGVPSVRISTAGAALPAQFTFELVNKTDGSGYIWSGSMNFNTPIEGVNRKTGSSVAAYLELRPFKHPAISAKTGIASPTDDMIDIYITIPDSSSSGEWRLNIS